MTFGHDRIINSYGEPVQQSMTVNSRDMVSLNTDKLMLGIVLEVHPSDNDMNRSAYQREDRRGYMHTASVLIIEAGRGTYMPLDNVIITPDVVSGLDDYYEKLPRGCTAQINGQSFNSQLNHIDPYTLDGDWCVVGFLGGNMDQPFIIRYWPHARNTFDPATSGQRNPNQQGSQPYQDQVGRMLRRVNGVEFVVTKQGSLYISTYRANARLNYGDPITQAEGRFPRTLDADEGGSVKLWVKPSQTLELDWNPPVDGVGINGVVDPELPQTNPRTSGASPATDNTYILIDQDVVHVTVPEEIKVLSKTRILLESEEETTLTVGSNLDIDVTGDTSVSTSGLDVTVNESLDIDVIGNTTLTGVGPVTVQANSTLGITATGALTLAGSTVSIGAGGSSGTPGSLSVASGALTLGTGAMGGVVGGTPLNAAFTAFETAVTAAAGLATMDVAAWNALDAAVSVLKAAIQAAASSTTTVG